MITSTIGWTALAGVGIAAGAFGCSEGFNDVGEAETATQGSDGEGGTSGSSVQSDSGGPTNATTQGGPSSSSSGGGADGTDSGVNTNNTTGSIDPDPARCDDGLVNGTETDLDCGGESCPPCDEGQQCYYDSDCDDLLCIDEECSSNELPDTCTDGVLNDTETDVDCGGVCAACEVGAVCDTGDDCATRRCMQGLCEPARAELEDCSASPAAVVDYDTNQELEQLLIGSWLACPDYVGDPLGYGTPAGSVGIEFTNDYRFHYLFENEDGELVRGEGIDLSGEWYVESDNQGATTVAGPNETVLVKPPVIPSQGNSYYRPTFTDGPKQMRPGGHWNLFQSQRYVPLGEPE